MLEDKKMAREIIDRGERIVSKDQNVFVGRSRRRSYLLTKEEALLETEPKRKRQRRVELIVGTQAGEIIIG